MPFQERNAWACLLAILAVYTPYFWITFQYPVAGFPLYLGAVFLLVIILSVFHFLNAIFTRQILATGDVPRPDERERQIELHSAKVAGLTLSSVVTLWTFAALMWVASQVLPQLSKAADRNQAISEISIPAIPIMFGIQILFLSFVAANVIYYAAIIYGHRRSV